MAKSSEAARKSVKRDASQEGGNFAIGQSGEGGRVKSKKQAIAIGLSEARKKGAKVPRKKK